MSVLPFHRRSAEKSEVGSGDWTQQEFADFYRAHRLLVRNGLNIGLDRGLSDEGDPWAVFFDSDTQDVFLHIARIDGTCLLVSDALDIRITESSIPKLVATFEAAIVHLIAAQATRNSNVILHPVARILIAISTVFLLFKLENGPAYAKNAANDHGGFGGDGAKKYDSVITHRAASIVQRLYELVDSPAVVAAVAGVLVAVEISKILPQAIDDPAQVQHEPTQAEIAINLGLPHSDQADHVPVQQTAHSQELHVSLDPSSEMPIVAHTRDLNVSPSAAEWHMPQIWLEAGNESAPVGSGSAASSEGAPDVSSASANAEVKVKADASPEPDGGTHSDAKADLSAVDLVQALIAQFEANAADAMLAVTVHPVQDDVEDTIPAAPRDADGPVGEISLHDLDDLVTAVGFFFESQSEGEQLMDMLAHLIEQFGAVDIEFEGSDVLIEQAHIEDAAAGSVGIWVNVMSDGSRISVVGSSEIVDDVMGAAPVTS